MTIDGWTTAPLGDIAPARSNGFPQGNAEVWNLSLDEVESITGRILRRTTCLVSELGSAKCSFDAKHVLYSKLRPYLNKVVIPEEAGVGTSELIPMLPDPNRLDREYLAYYLRSSLFLDFANANTRGANLPRIAMKELWKHEIPIPESLGEQRRIVARIMECMKRVEEIEGLRVEAVEEAGAIYPSRCHDFFNTKAQTEGWSSVSIGDLAISIQYGYTQSATKNPVGPQFLRITDIQNHAVNWETVPYCEADAKQTAKYKLAANDILFARTGATTGKSFLIENDPPLSVFASYLIRLQIDQKRVLPRLVYHFFQSPLYWDQIRQNMRGGAQPNINSKVLASIKLTIPADFDAQQDIVDRLDEAFAISMGLGNSQQRQREAIGFIRESILRKAFAGEL